MKILVTGGHGFLGKTLVPLLEKKYGKSSLTVPSSAELDLMDREKVEHFMTDNKFDTVVHLAARMSGIGELMKNPQKYLEENLEINYNVVKGALASGVTRFVTLGSSCGYNNDTPLPMREEYFWHLKPENTYGLCKLVMLEHLMSQKQMKWSYLVPGNLYGPYDHFGDAKAHLIPATVSKFLNARKNNEKSINVWGDGSQIRDFILVDDAAKIIADSIENDKFYGQPVNISANEGISVREIVELIQDILGMQDIAIDWDITKPTGIMKKVLANDVMVSIIGNNYLTPIKEGLELTINWFMTNCVKQEGSE